MNDPNARGHGYQEHTVIAHHVHLRPTLDGSRVVDVTIDLTAEQFSAAAHAVRSVVDDRYRVAVLESADDILAMREMTSLADELTSLVVPGAIAQITLTVAGAGRFRTALEDYIGLATDDEAVRREDDVTAMPHVYAIVDGVADAHAGAVRAALETQPA
jgi:hypothetical protein